MGKNLSSGKRPQAKLKVMAKLGENIYRSTKIFRYLQAREEIGMAPKAKWQNFLTNNQGELNTWRQWWNSPQSARWKNLQETVPEHGRHNGKTLRKTPGQGRDSGKTCRKTYPNKTKAI